MPMKDSVIAGRFKLEIDGAKVVSDQIISGNKRVVLLNSGHTLISDTQEGPVKLLIGNETEKPLILEGSTPTPFGAKFESLKSLQEIHIPNDRKTINLFVFPLREE